MSGLRVRNITKKTDGLKKEKQNTMTVSYFKTENKKIIKTGG